jgi:hypothetical protein
LVTDTVGRWFDERDRHVAAIHALDERIVDMIALWTR